MLPPKLRPLYNHPAGNHVFYMALQEEWNHYREPKYHAKYWEVVYTKEYCKKMVYVAYAIENIWLTLISGANGHLC